jgi:hypothetical protein
MRKKSKGVKKYSIEEITSPLQTLENRGKSISNYMGVNLWVGWLLNIQIIVAIMVVLYFYELTSMFFTLLAVLVSSTLYTTDRRYQPQWGYRIGEWVMHQAKEYFSLRVFCEDAAALNASKTVIFAIEPHDVLPISMLAFHDCLGYFPGLKALACVTSICFTVPIMRHIYTWVSATTVDRNNMKSIISEGISPVVCPGGMQEVVLMENPDQCVLYLRNRFGIIKIAMQTGVPLVPSFAFGQRAAYRFWIPKSALLQAIGRKIGFLPMVFFGIGNLPLAQPSPCPLTVVVGAPIHVSMVQDPSKDQIQKVMDELLAAYTRIFEKNKDRFGMSKVTLRIC